MENFKFLIGPISFICMKKLEIEQFSSAHVTFDVNNIEQHIIGFPLVCASCTQYRADVFNVENSSTPYHGTWNYTFVCRWTIFFHMTFIMVLFIEKQIFHHQVCYCFHQHQHSDLFIGPSGVGMIKKLFFHNLQRHKSCLTTSPSYISPFTEPAVA